MPWKGESFKPLTDADILWIKVLLNGIKASMLNELLFTLLLEFGNLPIHSKLCNHGKTISLSALLRPCEGG